MIGSLFKNAPTMVTAIVQTLRSTTLNEAFTSEVQKRKKFGLFILDDMVEPPSDSDFEAADDIQFPDFSDLEEERNYICK